MKIILDFDNTLFHEEPFARNMRERFQEYGISDDIYDKSVLEARDGEVWLQFRLMKLLAERSSVPFSHLKQALDAAISRAKEFLYPDVIAFLQTVQADHQVSILTFGDDKFQRMKVAGAGISWYLQNVVVTQDIQKVADAEALALGEAALFIDDNPRALEAVKNRALHITTVRMRRGHGKYTNAPSGRGVDYEIQNLNELQHLLL